MTHDAGPDSRPTHEDHVVDRRRRWPVRIAVLIGLLVMASVAYWLMTEGPGQALLSPAGSTVADFSGEGDQTTDAFEVREGWSIHWENTGETFAFAISGDRDFGTVIQQQEPGSGVTSPVGEGSYRLEIVADGPWTIQIVQGE